MKPVAVFIAFASPRFELLYVSTNPGGLDNYGYTGMTADRPDTNETPPARLVLDTRTNNSSTAREDSVQEEVEPPAGGVSEQLYTRVPPLVRLLHTKLVLVGVHEYEFGIACIICNFSIAKVINAVCN